MYSHFQLFGQAPVIFVNVLDPEEHKSVVVPAAAALVDDAVTLEVEGILLDTLTVKSDDDTTTYVRDTDFIAEFDKNGYVVVTRKSTGAIPAADAALKIGYAKLDPSAVQSADVIGGIDGTTGKRSGLELLQQVFPRFGLVPGLLLAPGFSHDPLVAAAMLTKASSINEHFKCLALLDIPTDTVTNYTLAPEWKTENNIVSERQILCYPKVRLEDKLFHLSTQLAGVICQTDQTNGGVPVASPSNRTLQINGALLSAESDLYLGPEEANYLNANGIVTALNFVGGWKAWGNRTAAYPGVTDPINAFIPIRRMFDWISNAVILTYWQKLDNPANKRLIESVTDGINIWLNGLQAVGYILGGRVEFLKEENSTTDMMDGKLQFHLFVTPPSPAQEFDFLLEYDAQYLAALTA